MKLTADEVDLLGHWLMKGSSIVPDETCKRIKALVSEHLILLGSDPSGWDDLYRDPCDGRLWERTWPESATHGGGPPRLSHLAADAARKKYGTIVDA
ncbi:MAG: hypothetical protein HC814_00745 [Rhodobacteraceae bacterium]|nr:hypothetical protein [Paracoccaceae bacterium]